MRKCQCHVMSMCCVVYHHMLKSIVDLLLCQYQGLLVASGCHSICHLSFVLMSILVRRLVMRITSLVLGLALNSFCHFIRQSAVYSIPLNMYMWWAGSVVKSVALVGVTSTSLGHLFWTNSAAIRGRGQDRPLHKHPASAAGGGALRPFRPF